MWYRIVSANSREYFMEVPGFEDIVECAWTTIADAEYNEILSKHQGSSTNSESLEFKSSFSENLTYDVPLSLLKEFIRKSLHSYHHPLQIFKSSSCYACRMDIPGQSAHTEPGCCLASQEE